MDEDYKAEAEALLKKFETMWKHGASTHPHIDRMETDMRLAVTLLLREVFGEVEEPEVEAEHAPDEVETV